LEKFNLSQEEIQTSQKPQLESLPVAEKSKDSFLSFLGELPVLILTAVVVAWIIKTLIVQPFFIPSSSMEPTLLPYDRVLVSKFIYRFTEPKPGDIIVFAAPETSGQFEQDFIKRVVATEGMKLQVKAGTLYINGKPKKEPYIRPDSPTSFFQKITVPKDTVFVMGDNRANSKDSRYFGPIKKDQILGKAYIIYWPLNRFGWLH